MADGRRAQRPAEVVDAEFAFHRAFNRASGRIKLAWFLLHAARYLPPHIYADDPQWGVQAVANRRQLIAALRRRDVDTVVRLTGDQFTDGARRLTARLDELGPLDVTAADRPAASCSARAFRLSARWSSASLTIFFTIGFGTGIVDLDVQVDGQQRRRPHRDDREQLLLLGEQVALLHHGLNLVLARVVDGLDVGDVETPDGASRRSWLGLPSS